MKYTYTCKLQRERERESLGLTLNVNGSIKKSNITVYLSALCRIHEQLFGQAIMTVHLVWKSIPTKVSRAKRQSVLGHCLPKKPRTNLYIYAVLSQPSLSTIWIAQARQNSEGYDWTSPIAMLISCPKSLYCMKRHGHNRAATGKKELNGYTNYESSVETSYKYSLISIVSVSIRRIKILWK